MSGIFGIVNFDGRPVEQGDLKKLSDTLAHRGPDRANIWLENDIGLGQLMLCSTKESLNEQLPWEDPQSGLVITADARIDNRDELGSALAMNSERVPSLPDSQLILVAFRKWGKLCVDHLLGDFSFAIWDKNKRQLFVARDHLGIRPFYYYACGDCFVFASAAKGISLVSRVPHALNKGRVADFLINDLEGINHTSTFFENIYRMPPAHFGVVEHNNVSFQRYWQLDPESCLQLSSDDEYADAFEEVLTLSIKARQRSHQPVSAMLSGGADSSTIAGIANKLCHENGNGPFRTYSAVSDDISSCCESSFINLMIEQGGLDPVLVSPAEVKKHGAEFDRFADIMEDPFDDSWTMLRLIYLAAREQGNVVVMDGMGGDSVADLTGNYPAYLLRQGEIKYALREIKGERGIAFDGQIGWLKAHMQAIRPVIIPQWLRQLKASIGSDEVSDGMLDECLTDAMLSKEFVKEIKLTDRWQEYRGQTTSGFCLSLRHAHAETIVVPYQTAAIERYERLASYCGVEARQPFFDKRVVELCLSLPWQQKVQNGWRKYCLRNVLQRVAPAEVAWRSEFDSIMWKFGIAWDEVNQKKNLETISKNRGQLLSILDKNQLDQMLNRYNGGDEDAMPPIWNLVTLLQWMQRNQLEI